MRINSVLFGILIAALSQLFVNGAAGKTGATGMNDSLWSKIKNRTWTEDNGWAGRGYTFFEDTSGVKKCLIQTYGSGVYVTLSEITLVKIINDSQLQIGHESAAFLLTGDSILKAKDRNLKRENNGPKIFNRDGPLELSAIQSSDFKVESLRLEGNVSYMGLGEALKKHLSSLSVSERNRIPVEFQRVLLSYGASDSNGTVGGWWIRDGETLKLTRWHILSDQMRVSASLEAKYSPEGNWSFGHLVFTRAKVLPRN